MANTFLSNLHTHSRYSDGMGNLEEYIQAAVALGFKSVGISEHAYAPYDLECCIKQEDMARYFLDMQALRQRYAGQIEVYIGLESDALYPVQKEGLDFVIGSAHYVYDEKQSRYYSIDYLPEQFEAAIQAFGGVRELVGRYYKTVAQMALEQQPDILGHLDLIAKLNGDGSYFDEQAGWYKALVEQTLEEVQKSGCIVEVNTGGMRRGYRKEPYPTAYILDMMRSHALPLTLSSDAHEPAALDFYFAEALQMLKKIGFKSVKQMAGGRFADIEI